MADPGSMVAVVSLASTLQLCISFAHCADADHHGFNFAKGDKGELEKDDL